MEQLNWSTLKPFFNQVIDFLIFKQSFIWLCWVFVAAWAFSSCGERGLLSGFRAGVLIAVASLVLARGR